MALNILYIAKVDLAGNSGSTVHVIEICKHLTQSKVVVHLIAPKPSQELNRSRLGYLQNVHLHFLPYRIGERSGLADRPYIDILCFNLLSFLIGLRILLMHHIDIIHERLNLFEVVGGLLHIISRKPLILEINAPLLNEQIILGRIKPNSLIEKVARKIYQWSLFHATRISCVSSTLKKILVQRYFVPPLRVHVIHNGVDTDSFSPQKLEKPTDLVNKKIIMFVGSLRPWHGVQLILKALPLIRQEVSNVSLIIVGDGPQKRKLIIQSKDLDILDTVAFVGSHPHEDVLNFLNLADVLVAPYPKSTIELGYCPLKILEYMSVGKPTISSSLPFISEILTEDCGFLIDCENTLELAKTTSNLLKDEKLSFQLGANARKRVVELFSWKTTVEKTLVVYLSCLNNVANKAQSVHYASLSGHHEKRAMNNVKLIE